VHAASPVIEIRTNTVLFTLDAVEALLGGSNGIDELLNIEVSVVLMGRSRSDIRAGCGGAG